MRIKLVVGLGNPGKEYENTRHNMGFRVLDELNNRLGNYNWKSRDNGLFFDCNINFNKIIFLKPQNYINLSGDVLIKYVNFFGIKISDILVISDDLDLPVGTIKIKEKGSSGGHNGLKNIEQRLKTSEYKRIKIGISNNKDIDTKNYVLGKLSKEEESIIDTSTKNAADATIMWLNDKFTDAMNKYNTKIKDR